MVGYWLHSPHMDQPLAEQKILQNDQLIFCNGTTNNVLCLLHHQSKSLLVVSLRSQKGRKESKSANHFEVSPTLIRPIRGKWSHSLLSHSTLNKSSKGLSNLEHGSLQQCEPARHLKRVLKISTFSLFLSLSMKIGSLFTNLRGLNY